MQAMWGSTSENKTPCFLMELRDTGLQGYSKEAVKRPKQDQSDHREAAYLQSCTVWHPETPAKPEPKHSSWQSLTTNTFSVATLSTFLHSPLTNGDRK